MPNTEKIDIDPDNGPRKYGDKALRCSQCDVHGPSQRHFVECPQCGVATSHVGNQPPDMRWPEAVKILLEERFETFYKEGKEEKTLETLESFANIVEAA